jgi:hypothetical protein
LNSSPEEIQEYFIELAFEAGAIEKEVTDICWYMRGSISWEQAWRLSNHQRQLMIKRIKANIDATEKSGLPLL